MPAAARVQATASGPEIPWIAESARPTQPAKAEITRQKARLSHPS